MTLHPELRARTEMLANRHWDLPAIEKRFKHLAENGISKKQVRREEAVREKKKILDRVQERAEEYCYLTRSCAKGSCLALLEEFGMGSMGIIKALGPFPGLAMTGGICGPVAGGLIALGLFFSDEDPADYENPRAYFAARDFIERFEEVFESTLCTEIQKQLLGKAYDPFAGLEELTAFNASGAREKCPAAPGFGARIAAEIIIERL
ncbi:MAG: C-GCAxxG-C-C family protein [Desulfobacterales bacterium]